MRFAILLVGAVSLVGLVGCCGQNTCGVGTKPWGPACATSWDWYVPCDLVEGREQRRCGQCDAPPGCVCGWESPRPIVVAPAPPEAHMIVVEGGTMIEGAALEKAAP
jgi:hypothetical protein